MNRRRLKYILILVVAVAVTAGVIPIRTFAGRKPPLNITVLFFNDTHGHLRPFKVKTDSGKEEVGGIARLAALAEKIYNEVLDLPAEDRLTLLDRLLHVSNLPTQADIDQAWSAEIERREQQIENGTATLIPAEEVFAKINARLAK